MAESDRVRWDARYSEPGAPARPFETSYLSGGPSRIEPGAPARPFETSYLSGGPSRIESGPVPLPAPRWLADVEHLVPTQGRALDLAAGAGRISGWLAARGLDVTAVDISPAGLELARQNLQAKGLTVKTIEADLETQPSLDFIGDGAFDVVTCFLYRQRDLFPAIRAKLQPGGIFLGEVLCLANPEPGAPAHPFETSYLSGGPSRIEPGAPAHPFETSYLSGGPSRIKRHESPSRQYLAEPGELRQDCAGLEILYYEEGWFDNRATARVAARLK